jgi:hypothetical protein
MRCCPALLKQQRQSSYEELAFHLENPAVISGLCAIAAHLFAKEISAASDDHTSRPTHNEGQLSHPR